MSNVIVGYINRKIEGTTEDEMVGWHRQLNGHEFEQALRDGKGQEAWHAAVHGATKSWTRLSDLALMHKNIFIRMWHTEVQQLSQTSVCDGQC